MNGKDVRKGGEGGNERYQSLSAFEVLPFTVSALHSCLDVPFYNANQATHKRNSHATSQTRMPRSIGTKQ